MTETAPPTEYCADGSFTTAVTAAGGTLGNLTLPGPDDPPLNLPGCWPVGDVPQKPAADSARGHRCAACREEVWVRPVHLDRDLTDVCLGCGWAYAHQTGDVAVRPTRDITSARWPPARPRASRQPVAHRPARRLRRVERPEHQVRPAEQHPGDVPLTGSLHVFRQDRRLGDPGGARR